MSGSPVTGSGTLALSLATQTANFVWAGPTTGSAATPTFRALVAADIPSLSYISALTGDVTATGPGSVAATLATVNGNVGSFTNVSLTVNAKGLITAASSGTTGNLTDAGTDGIVVTSGTGAVLGSGTSLAQHVADTTHNGYLSSTDWNTFNGKQASGSYITALTGDVTASGPGSSAATLAATSNATLASLNKTTGVTIHGTNTNDSAASGYVGEFVSANPGSPVTPAASDAFKTITSISLTAGDYDVEATGILDPGTIVGTRILFMVSLTNNGSDASNQGGIFNLPITISTAFASINLPTGVRRISLSTTTTVYLVGLLTYSVLGGATFDTSSILQARRVR